MLYNKVSWTVWGVFGLRCIKCGRELKKQQVFCDACQEDMRGYPVNPGTPIQLPTRPAAAAAKRKPARVKKQLSPEERVVRLRSSVRLLTLGLIAAVLAFAVAAVLLLHLLNQRDSQADIGQNYRTVAHEN